MGPNWGDARFGELCASSAFGPRFPATAYAAEGQLATLRTTDMDDEGNIETSTMPLAAISPSAFAAHLLQRGDLVISRSGTCGIAGVFPGHHVPVVPGAFLIRFRLRAPDASQFYRRYFNSSVGRPGLDRLAVGGVQKNLTATAVLGVRVPTPPPEEQRQIAAILDTLDDAIRKTEQIIAKLKQVKQGLLHDLLTRGIDDNGELRDPERHPEQFKDSALGRIPKGWSQAVLGDLVDPVRPIAYGILMPGTGHQGGVPVVKVKDIKNGRIELGDLLRTSPAIDHEYRRSRLRPGDLLFTIRGTVGRMAVVPPELDQANITQDTARIALVRGDSRFIRAFLDMPRPRTFIETHTIGVAVRGINLRDVRRIPVAEPPPAEAREIAHRLEATDAKLEMERAAMLKLSTLKRGLMEDLLTGRVRVTALLENASP